MRRVVKVCVHHIVLACKLDRRVTLGHMTPSYIFSSLRESILTILLLSIRGDRGYPWVFLAQPLTVPVNTVTVW